MEQIINWNDANIKKPEVYKHVLIKTQEIGDWEKQERYDIAYYDKKDWRFREGNEKIKDYLHIENVEWAYL